MGNFIIKSENLGKKYNIRHRGDSCSRYVALRDVIASNVRSFMSSLKNPFKKKKQGSEIEEFWALKEVSFDVKEGERVGVIGRNGAGKSTLLKLISRITEPSAGRIILKGRVASLLEVGTGFHPELTGRENIFLNGSILGMTKIELKKKFDEIVEFAEVEKFLDTPVKRYSSGMYVRLAFAVAAHLETEILLVDEVLAVGDMNFQKKCLGKMEEIGTQGKTILFVSHNMAMITSLCPLSILLNKGKIIVYGNTSDVILQYYTGDNNSPVSFDYSDGNTKVGDEYIRLFGGAIKDKEGHIISEININQSFHIFMHYRVLKNSNFLFVPNFHFFTADGIYAFILSNKVPEILSPGDYYCECYIPGDFLNDGTYFVGLAISSFESGVKVHFYEKDILSFNIKDNLYERSCNYMGPMPGVVRPKVEWRFY